MSNIVERLRSPANVFYEYAADNGAFLREAADEITRLRAELAAVTAERDMMQNKTKILCDGIAWYRAANSAVTAERDRMREALKETLAIARRNEAGDYVDRALAALEGVTNKGGAGNE